MKKTLLVFSILLSLTSARSLASPISDLQNSIYGQVRQNAVESFSALFNRKITIERAEGRLIGQIDFINFTIPGIGTIKKMTLNYNPIKMLETKGDIVPALYEIVVEDGNFNIIRNNKGEINLVSAFSNGEEASKTAPPPFKGKIILRNCVSLYSDQQGFKPGPSNFHANVSALNGTINLNDLNNIRFTLSAKIPEQLNISGSIKPSSANYSANINIQNVSLKKWGNYITPLAELKINGGSADIDLAISSPKGKATFPEINGKAQISKFAAKYQEYSISEAMGEVGLNKQTINIKRINAKLNGIPFRLDGNVSNFNELKLNLQATIKELNVSSAKTLLPQLAAFPISGNVSGKISISGSASKPVVSGRLSPRGTLLSCYPFSGETSFVYKASRLSLKIDPINLFNGSIYGEVGIDLAKSNPDISGRLSFKSLNLAAVGQALPGIIGAVNGSATFSGNAGELKGECSTDLSNTNILGNRASSLSFKFKSEDGGFFFKEIRLVSEDMHFYAEGGIDKTNKVSFEVISEKMNLSAPTPLGDLSAHIRSFRGNISFVNGPDFIASPLKNLSAAAAFSISSTNIGEQTIENISGEAVLKDGFLTIDNLFMQEKSSRIKASGSIGIGNPTNLKINCGPINLEEIKIINLFLPAEIRNPKGILTIEAIATGMITNETDLLGLNCETTSSLSKGTFSDIPISFNKVKTTFHKKALTLPESNFLINNSKQLISLNLDQSGNIEASFKGILDLSLLNRISTKYGLVKGVAGAHILLDGSLSSPQIRSDLKVRDLAYEGIRVGDVSGKIDYYNGQYSFPSPLNISGEAGNFELSGDVSVNQQFPEKGTAQIQLTTKDCKISNLIVLADKLQKIIQVQPIVVDQNDEVTVNSSALTLSSLEAVELDPALPLYDSEGNGNSIVRKWQKIRSSATKEVAPLFGGEKFEGKLNSKIILSGTFDNLSGSLDGEISKLTVRDFTFDKLAITANYQDQSLVINRALLSKDRGTLALSGSIMLAANPVLSLESVAKDFPISVLQLVFPKKELKGSVNFSAAINGSVNNPQIDFSGSGKKLSLSGTEFDNISLSANYSDSLFTLDTLSMQQGSARSSIHGSINLAPPLATSFDIALNGSAIGLLNLLSNDVRWIKGAVPTSIKIRGNADDLKINGKIKFVGGVLLIAPLNSAFSQISGEVEVTDNLAQLKNFGGVLNGDSTSDPLSITGSIDLTKLITKAGTGQIGFDLNIPPANLSLKVPGFFVGKVQSKGIDLQGPLALDYKSGPKFSGNFIVNDAVLTLSTDNNGKGNSGKNIIFPLNFGMDVKLNKNVYIVMGDVSTLNLSTILMNLEVGCEGLHVGGTLATPSLNGKVQLKRGTVNIFNREFTLLSKDMVKKYFPYDSENTIDNYASFAGEEGSAGVLPKINLTAQIEVENTEKDASGKNAKKKVFILANLKGKMGAKSEGEGLKIFLAGYNEDKSKSPAEMTPMPYSEQDLKVMLLPDFIKSFAGIGTKDETQVDTNVVIADYLSSRVQSMLFRSLEREAEQKLGLESLTLEYNLGPKVKEALGLKDTRNFQDDKPAWSVGFVKGLADRLYLDVRYSQPMEGRTVTTAQNSFNYQLTYKLTPICSILYYREPINVYDLTTGYQKVTLKFGYSFW